MLLTNFFNFELAHLVRSIFRYLIRILIIIGVCACSSLPEKRDEVVKMSLAVLKKEAKNALNTENWSRCSKYFLSIQEREPFGQESEEALLNAAYCSYKNQENHIAEEIIDRFVRLYPQHVSADYAYYLKGLLNFNDNMGFLGKFSGQNLAERDPHAMKLAYDAFSALVEKFPRSRYTEDASLKINYLENALASYQIHVARTYYVRGAYLAALNRAQKALKEYPNNFFARDALQIMIDSYHHLGEKKLAYDAKEILKKMPKLVNNRKH